MALADGNFELNWLPEKVTLDDHTVEKGAQYETAVKEWLVNTKVCNVSLDLCRL